VAWHRTISEQLPTARLVLNEAARPLVELHGLYAGHDVHYVKLGRWTHRSRSINLDLTRPLNVGMTTGSSVAIPLALSLGLICAECHGGASHQSQPRRKVESIHFPPLF